MEVVTSGSATRADLAAVLRSYPAPSAEVLVPAVDQHLAIEPGLR